MNPARPRRLARLLAFLLLGAAARASETAPPPPSAPQTGPAAAEASAPADQRRAEYAGVLRIGQRKLENNETDAAMIAFREALRLAQDDDEKADALLHIARAHRRAGDGIKAVAAYELLLRDHPSWSRSPLALLEVGRALRELGAHRLAISRLYSVIQSTLRLPDAEARSYRQLVRTAQFEIAETHFIAGDTAEALRFFRRLDSLDLAPADRARARLRAAQAALMEGDRAVAVSTLRLLLGQDGNSADAAEARFLLARLHAEDGRREEALQVTLDLLRGTQGGEDAAAAREWRRRAGQFLAAKFRDEKDFTSALLLYRALADLDQAPAWRAPLLYQIGLCLERLEQPAKARAAYAELIRLAEAPEAAGAAELVAMARWRSDQIDWMGRVREGIHKLAPPRETATLPEPART